MEKAKYIKWLVNGYEPFLPIDSIREIEAWASGCPIIKGTDGHKLILNRPEHYKLITN